MAEDSINSLKESSFNKELNQSVPEIMEKYVSLIVEYTTFIRDKSNITHVFIMILFYTKNIELTYYHSQKSFYYYVEFIEQILDVQHTFLHLSSRDASIFVYKKTIYEINQEHRKETENNADDDERFKQINAYAQIYKEVPIEILPTFHANIIKLNLTMEQLGKVFNYVSDVENDVSNFHQII